MSQPWREPPRFDPLGRLRKFGAKPPMGEHYQGLLRLLKSQDIMEVMQGASQLSSELVMAQEDTLATFPLEQLTPPLVACLQKEGLEDVSLFAINCLNQLAEIHPSVCALITESSGVAAVCSKLSNLSYIDTSEQAIKLLEKLSFEFSPQILQEGGLVALLTVLDFFEAPTQKKVMSVVVNLGRSVHSQELFTRQIVPALPIISSLLQYRGKDSFSTTEKSLEFCVALTTSMERLSRDCLRSNLQLLCEHGVLRNAMELGLAVRALWPLLFRLFAAMCRNSGEILTEWIETGGSDLVAAALNGDEGEEEKPRLAAYVMDALQLIDAVLPSPRQKKPTPISDLYQRCPSLLHKFCSSLLPQLFLLYNRFVNRSARQLTLDILEKMLGYERLLELVTPGSVAGFLAEVIRSKELSTVAKAMRIAKAVYEKVPQLMASAFTREGVIARIATLPQTSLALESPSSSLFLRETAHRSRLRLLLEGADGRSDPRLLDHYLRLLQRRDTEEEDEFAHFVRGRTPGADPETEMRKEVDTMVREVVTMHEKMGKEIHSHVLTELKSLSSQFQSNSSDTADSLLTQFLHLLTSEAGITPFELSASDLSSSLWQWLTCGQDFRETSVPGKRLAGMVNRVREFVRGVTREEGQWQGLVTLLGEVVARDQQLPLTIYESPLGGSQLLSGLRTLCQKVAIHLTYAPTPLDPSTPSALRAELEAKDSLFASIGSLGIAMEQFQSVGTLCGMLGNVRNKEDLSGFRTATRWAGLRGVSPGQMTFIRHHIQMQQAMGEPADIRRTLSDLGIFPDGNEELISTLQEELRPDREDMEEAELEEATVFHQRESQPNLTPSTLVATVQLGQSPISETTTLFELNSKYSEPFAEEPLRLSFRFVENEARQDAESARFAKSPWALLWMTVKEANECGGEEMEGIGAAMKLLKLLHMLNQYLPGLFSRCSPIFPGTEDLVSRSRLPPARFHNARLSALLAKQTQDAVAIIGHTANPWVYSLPCKCPFAFPFEVRAQLFRVSGVQANRAMQNCARRMKVAGDVLQLRSAKHKVKVDRTKVMEIARKTFSDSSLLRTTTLEFDYLNEEGTGAGPTLEFYSLTAQAIRGLAIWRDSGEECGLFPASNCTDLGVFAFIGKFVGKVLSEDRVIDLPLSPSFWKLVFGDTLSLLDLQYVDKSLHRHLSDLMELAAKRNTVLANTALTMDMKERQLAQMTLKGTNVGELGLNFVLPGTNFPLKEGGADQNVTLETLEEYVTLVAEQTLMQYPQACSFRSGLSSLISLPSLSTFSGEELETLLCGDPGHWDMATLAEAVVPAHGYTKTSAVYQYLLRTMCEMTLGERKQCLQFLTGCPRLPIGGFKALSPPLTVVRKSVNGPADSFLPSVMTCQNYLKLPEYSSESVLAQQLRYACREALEAFHLSYCAAAYNFGTAFNLVELNRFKDMEKREAVLMELLKRHMTNSTELQQFLRPETLFLEFTKITFEDQGFLGALWPINKPVWLQSFQITAFWKDVRLLGEGEVQAEGVFRSLRDYRFNVITAYMRAPHATKVSVLEGSLIDV